MSDAPAENVDTSESNEPVEQPSETAPETGGNPAWEPIRSELDPLTFHRIEPILKDMDRNVQQKIESTTKQYGWAKELADAGHTPEYLQQAVGFAQMLNEKPEELYQKLGEFLEQTGRMPNAEEQQQLAEEVSEEDDDQQTDLPPEVQAALERIEAFEQQQRDFLEQQAAEEESHEAESWLDSEVEALKTAHPEYTDDDIQEVIRRAAFHAQQTGQPIEGLAQFDAEYLEFQNRILSKTRPGQTAPRLVPASGGVPTSQPKKSLGELSSGETQDLIAGYLSQGKQ